MRRCKMFSEIAMVFLIFTSCAGSRINTVEKMLTGVYLGAVSCNSCDPALVMVKLNQDDNYVMETLTKGNTEDIIQSQGNYLFQKRTNKLILSENQNSTMPNEFTVHEKSLIPLNGVEGDDSSLVLIKDSTEIYEKYWQLIELNGKEVKTFPDNPREPHLIIKYVKNKVFGSGGCNSYSGNFYLAEDHEIRFSNFLTTKMACDNIQLEIEYLDAFREVYQYQLENDTLIFKNNKNKILMRFVFKP